MAILNGFRSARGAEFRHGERKGCLKHTREAVLNTIELWARDFDESSVYWLNGLAGTGKSTIAKTIADRLFADGQLGASFFCSRDFEDRRNLHFIFPTLATQLARKFPEFRSILVPLIQSDQNIAYESLYSQMEKLIVRPLSKTSISTVIVIDALDECEDEESSSAILFVLGQLASRIPKVKFFLTGRPESRISQGFRPLLLKKMADKFVLHDVKPDQVNSDIRVFFTTSFSELARRRGGLDGWPTEMDLDRLCEQAAGLFVYAAATVKFVDNNKWDPKRRLNNILWSRTITGHEGKTLDLLYTTILQQAFGDGDTDDHTKMRSVLGVVVLATNPLSPSAIATLLGLNAEHVPPLLSSVNSLLILHEDPDHPVRPFHKSFPDFISDPNRCTDKRFHISPPDHHSQLLIRCLGLMDGSLKKNMCNLQGPVANSDVGDLRKRIDECINPALQYTCVSWHMHLIEAHATPADEPQIDRTLKKFMEKNFLFWLEVLSVLGAVRNAAEAMRAAVDWLKVCPVPALDVLPKFTQTGSRSHQRLSSLTTVFIL
jgi:NACHT domain